MRCMLWWLPQHPVAGWVVGGGWWLASSAMLCRCTAAAHTAHCWPAPWTNGRRHPRCTAVPQMYKEDGLREADMEALLRAFPAQPLDFFGALR